jgi:hypothetical protein
MATQTEHMPHMERPPQSLWNRVLAQPERAPELIALAAAERFGPQAEEWGRVAGAGHTPEQLAKVAYKKHVRLSRLEGGVLGVGGALTAAPDIVALIWIQSRMVFYIAAAHGYDPRPPMRPAELLALQGLYSTPAEAREALDGMGKLMAQAMAERALSSHRNDALHRRLKARAALEGMALSDYLIREVRKVAERPTPEEIRARLAARPAAAALPESPAQAVRAERDAR